MRLPKFSASSEESAGLRLLMIALAGAVLFHGGLLPFTHGNTYDAYIHMFFGDSYNRSWFDTWEPRWYTGFSTTSYPPGTHMLIGLLNHILPLRAAFVVVQLTGLLLLTVGIYRFSLLWVAPRPAGFAAIALILSSSISETIHLFGQLPTIFSLGIFLNGLPYVFRWIVFGGWRDFFSALVFTAATTAAHHVTTIFGGILFILPLGLHALQSVVLLHPTRTRLQMITHFLLPIGRSALLAAFMGVAIIATIFAYWMWSINDPITQVPIPHGSRENFLLRTDLGFIFFVLPWGMSILFLPYVVYKTVTSLFWPLGLSVLLCFILGTGGTTPISRAILQGAFDILTLDRFTFWATILILPFIGHLLDALLPEHQDGMLKSAFGRRAHRILVGGLFFSMTTISVFAAILPTIQQTQPKFIDPTPIVQFMESDNHDRWRYLTLGFGDQFAFVSAQTSALSVDGNYHSARRLPDLTRFSVERLENAKYLGVPGLGSLRQFLVNADAYNLKYVFSNDAFYDPLLYFTGWSALNRLSNGVVIWEKPDVTPLPRLLPRRHLTPVQTLMWGLFPPIALFSAALIFATSLTRRNFGQQLVQMNTIIVRRERMLNPFAVRSIVGAALVIGVSVLIYTAISAAQRIGRTVEPEEVIAAYFDDLDLRRFESAYERLDPLTRPDFESVMFNWRWRGGLIASFGKLTDINITETTRSDDVADWDVALDWLTALTLTTEKRAIRTVKRDGRWYITPTALRQVQTPVRLQRAAGVDFNLVGRRQPRPESDLHRDLLDRPDFAVADARLIIRNGRYSLVGSLYNPDVDPAFISAFGKLVGGGKLLATQSAAEVSAQTLLSAETGGFRIDFESVLSLDDALNADEFDPTHFIPPEFETEPEQSFLDMRALATHRNIYRGVALNGVRAAETTNGLEITGLAVNVGLETASIVRLVVLLLDLEGKPIWTEAGFVDTNIYPGQSTPFSFKLPARSEITVLEDLTADAITINGATTQPERYKTFPHQFTLAMPEDSGYSQASFHISTMTFDPLF